MSRNRFTKEQRDLSPLRELLLPIEGEVLEIGYRAEDADGTGTKAQS